MPRLYSRSLGPVQMDLDDLGDMVELLRGRTAGPVSINVGKYDADEPADLVDASNQDLASIEITTADPVVQVSLRPDRASVWSKTDDPGTIRLIDDIADQVNRCSLAWKIVFPWVMLANFAVMLVAVGALAHSFFNEGKTNLGKVALVVGLLAVIALAAYTPRTWRRQGAVAVVPKRRRDRRIDADDFKRKTTTTVIGVVIGAALGAVATWYLK